MGQGVGRFTAVQIAEYPPVFIGRVVRHTGQVADEMTGRHLCIRRWESANDIDQ